MVQRASSSCAGGRVACPPKCRRPDLCSPAISPSQQESSSRSRTISQPVGKTRSNGQGMMPLHAPRRCLASTLTALADRFAPGAPDAARSHIDLRPWIEAERGNRATAPRFAEHMPGGTPARQAPAQPSHLAEMVSCRPLRLMQRVLDRNSFRAAALEVGKDDFEMAGRPAFDDGNVPLHHTRPSSIASRCALCRPSRSLCRFLCCPADEPIAASRIAVTASDKLSFARLMQVKAQRTRSR